MILGFFNWIVVCQLIRLVCVELSPTLETGPEEAGSLPRCTSIFTLGTSLLLTGQTRGHLGTQTNRLRKGDCQLICALMTMLTSLSS